MDYLFKFTILDIPENVSIDTYYVVDNHLRYIAILCDDEYELHYMDTDKVGPCINTSKNSYEFDYYVFNLNKPIRIQTSTFGVINDKPGRVVSIQTISGNPILKKPKASESRNVITRRFTSDRKLF